MGGVSVDQKAQGGRTAAVRVDIQTAGRKDGAELEDSGWSSYP